MSLKTDSPSADAILWGDSPSEPINQISRAPRVLRSLKKAILEPSGEILPPPAMSSMSASFWASPCNMGIDHKPTAFPGVATAAINLEESGNQVPKTQEAVVGSMPGGKSTLWIVLVSTSC